MVTKKHFLIFALATTTQLATSQMVFAQGNENRLIMERLERLERNMNASRSGGAAASADADGNTAVMGSAGGDVQQQVFSLQDELRNLRGQLEKTEFENRTLKDKIERMEKDVDFRLNTLERATPAPGAVPASEASAVPSPTVVTAPPAEEKKTLKVTEEKKPVNAKPGELASIEEKAVDTSSEGRPPAATKKDKKPTTAGDGILSKNSGVADAPREHYNQAFRLLNQTRYDEAGDAFQTFVDKYPDDPLIGNAYYWLGETHYIQRNYVKAADSFRQGFEVLPNGPKAPDNLLKLAMTLRALNRNDDACTVLGQIKVKFKDSSTSLLDKAEQERTRIGCK